MTVTWPCFIIFRSFEFLSVITVGTLKVEEMGVPERQRARGEMEEKRRRKGGEKKKRRKKNEKEKENHNQQPLFTISSTPHQCVVRATSARAMPGCQVAPASSCWPALQ